MRPIHRATPPLAAALACAVLGASRLAAQAPARAPAAEHQGFWIGFGFGAGYQSIDCSACGPTPLPEKWRSGRSGGTYVALGGTLRPNLLLGGEVAMNFNTLEDPSASVGHVGVVAQMYPTRARRLFLRAGLGVGIALLTDSTLGFPEGQELGSGGLSVRAGLGYDVRFGGRFALAPYVDVMQALASGEFATVAGRRYRGPENPAAVQAGISFNWY